MDDSKILKANMKDGKIFQLIFDQAPVGIAVIDSQTGRFLDINEAYCRIAGYSKPEMLEIDFMQITHPDDLKEDLDSMKRLLTEEIDRYQMEKRYIRKDQKIVWVSLTVVPLWDENAEKLNHIAIVEDITEKKMAQEDLERHKGMLDATGHMARVGGWEFDAETSEITWTEETLRIHEVPIDYKPSIDKATEFFHPDDRPELLEAFQTALREGQPYDMEVRFTTAKGRQLWTRTICKPEVIDGRTTRLKGTFQDITEQKIAQNRLKELAEKAQLERNTLETLIRTAPVGVIVSDLNGNISFHNQAADDIVGGSITGDARGPKSGYQLAHIDGTPFAEEELPLVSTIIHNESIQDIELLIRRNDGMDILALANATPLRDDNGHARGAIAIMQDITHLKQAEKALRESEKELFAIYNNSPIIMVLVDEDRRVLKANKKALEAMGRPFDKIIGLRSGEALSCVHAAETGGCGFGVNCEECAVRNTVLDSLKTGKAQTNIEAPVQLMINDEIVDLCFLMSTSPLTIRGKKSVLICLEDITERKRVEEELLKSETRLRTLVDTIPDLVWLKDLNGVYLSCNPIFEQFFGAKESAIVGKTDYDFIDKDLADFFREHDRRALAAGKPSINEDWLTFADNGYKGLFETIKSPLRDVDGDLIGILGISRDISERKNAENRLRENQKRYESAQRIGHVGNWEYELVTEIFWGSDEAKRIYGFNLESKNFTIDEVEKCIPDRERVHQALIDLIKNNTPYDLEFEIHPVSGPKQKFIRSIAELQRDDSGKPYKVTGVIQDITRQKEKESEKQQLELNLRQAQKMESVGRLAGGVAHDFNNMLGAILGYTEQALEEVDEKHDLYDDLKEIQNAAKHSANLTKQLLTFARKEIISPKQLNLNDTVGSMLKMLHRLIGEDIDLVWQPSANLWPIKMDPTQIDQILANLCVNARDAIAGVGKLTIETGRHSFDAEYCNEHPGFIPGEFVLLAVSDDGCGMEKEILDNLFEPFFTTKDVGKGTGLGLATIYGIVKQNNGFINVYSEPGQGSTFKIYLPRLVADKETDKAAPEKKAPAGGTETILLVEDEPAIVRMTQKLLGRRGYTVLSAASPSEAVKKAKNHAGAIDLLITDVIMPEMNGRDLSRQINALHPDLRLLFISGYTANTIAHQGVLDDGVAFIQKPFSMTEITEKVRDVLDKASDEPQG